MLWIVAGADGVYVVLLPEFEVFQHQLFSDVMSGVFIVFVYIYTFYENWFTIDTKLVIFHFHGTETYFHTGCFHYLTTFGFLQADNKGVKVRSFSSPLFRAFDDIVIKNKFGQALRDSGNRHCFHSIV